MLRPVGCRVKGMAWTEVAVLLAWVAFLGAVMYGVLKHGI